MQPVLEQLRQRIRDRAEQYADDLLEDLMTSLPCIDTGKNDAPAHVLRDYSLVLEDNFESGVLDPLKWQTRFVWGPDLTINNEEQYYVDVLDGTGVQGPNPFVFNSAGNLEIQAIPIEGTKPLTQGGKPEGQNYWSGILTTRDSLSFTHGYAEVCAKMPPRDTDGAWPATWLLNTFYYTDAFTKNQAENGGVGNDKWNPEIDFMEAIYSQFYQNSDCIKNAYHYHTGTRGDLNNYSRWSIGSNFKEVDANTGQLLTQFNIYQDCDGNNQFMMPQYCGADYGADFHTYAVDWAPDYIHFYVDGIIVNCITGESLVSDQAMYLLINLAVGGNFPFNNDQDLRADITQYPASFEIQYARIYKR